MRFGEENLHPNAICSTWGDPKTAMAQLSAKSKIRRGCVLGEENLHPNAICSTWGDPKTAMAQLSARPSGMFLLLLVAVVGT
ncbi:hypothetical protein NIES267_15450 [Calothrix parasitica NIES-267]|uniref:Uncharacterized protein n=1 Tax=Calothrix parasitica NIES-267 TaxID=1973488 RepID=A0A1Z4LLE6_9CYAN|nr:hypothetical protein NIES267_15450 [Calothrix parasitica NIES-267]